MDSYILWGQRPYFSFFFLSLFLSMITLCLSREDVIKIFYWNCNYFEGTWAGCGPIFATQFPQEFFLDCNCILRILLVLKHNILMELVKWRRSEEWRTELLIFEQKIVIYSKNSRNITFFSILLQIPFISNQVLSILFIQIITEKIFKWNNFNYQSKNANLSKT